MSKARLMIVLAVLALIAVGCAKTAEQTLENQVENQLEEESGGDANVDINEDDGSVSIETDEGSMQIGGGEIPSDFPLPVPDHAAVLSVVSTSGENAGAQVSMSFDPGDFDDVAAMYDDFFNDQDWEVSRTNSDSDGSKVVIISGSNDELTTSVIVAYTDGEEMATLTAQYGNN
ncbi:MAG: hypothetical protein ACXW15_07285 [Acidimicrobiia bacterium]